MRDIKFRVWDNFHSEELNRMWYSDKESLGDFWSWVDQHPLDAANNLQQYTGIKDTDGKELYEGDIVVIPASYMYSTAENNICVVEYKASGFGYRDVVSEKFDYISSLIGTDDVDKDVKLIGNVYENPELLK